ncbi:MAG: bifunctional chorismate mutase/prephenate dehydratase [Acidimicrobiia bacterium]|nr:bifunctional chorismate mutase/prephenate dehydratase [Acidimicrobiia bacterium]MDH5502992.1 bifunctional chorismate mutase/prephenate dehydratase [Acidimicrobiia bacterium]
MIGYQGEPYSNSYEAASLMFPDRQSVGYHSFAEAFAAIADGSVELLVMPIENSTTGSILPVLDRLVGGGLTIVGEHLLEIHYALLGLPGADASQITTVHSHPEALRQAEGALVAGGFVAMPEHDTAGAVRLVSELGDPGHAALAPTKAAAAYGLEVLAEGVVDRQHNTTRFVVLAVGESPFASDANKTSVAFTGAHRPGALALALTELGLRGANLTRIESRPGDEAWQYRFFVDLLHEPGRDGYDRIFDPMPSAMESVHHLGTYPAGRSTTPS